MQTVQTKIRRRNMRRLIRVSTICLQNNLFKFEKNENTTQEPLRWKLTVQMISVIDNDYRYQ